MILIVQDVSCFKIGRQRFVGLIVHGLLYFVQICSNLPGKHIFMCYSRADCNVDFICEPGAGCNQLYASGLKLCYVNWNICSNVRQTLHQYFE